MGGPHLQLSIFNLTILHTKVIVILLLLATAVGAQVREYTPSLVDGARWDMPANINPIVPGYFADPTIRKFGNTYYIYATTDGTGNGYGPATVWMSEDFVNWRNVVMNWPTTEVVWAPDVVRQANGKYRYYYCEPCNINVGESDSPIGPWTNILGSESAVLVPDRYIHNNITLDPMLFHDDDGREYLYFTTWGIYKGFGCGVARLNDGKYTLDELQQYRDARYWNENAPYPIAADKFFDVKKLITNDELKDIFEAPFVFKKDGIYYFTYSSGSCHTDTYRVQYATSKIGPMGPFEYKGEILTTNADGSVHGPGHHSVLEEDGKYYIVYHRHNIQKSVHGFNRQLCIDKLEFDEVGNIKRVVPTHNGINPLTTKSQKATSKYKNLAFGAKVTASTYYDDNFKPSYAVDDNNATLWKAARCNWDGKQHNEWLQVDLGKVMKFNEIWTQFEYPTFFYQYKIETSIDGHKWLLYADKTTNSMQGSPMIDKAKAKARYIRLSIVDTQKNGHMPAIWNIKVWGKAPKLPSAPAASNEAYPLMHMKDVEANKRNHIQDAIKISASEMAKNATAPFNIESCDGLASDGTKSFTFIANKPIRTRVKNGSWAFFLNGTQYLRSKEKLPEAYRYNAPYTIIVRALQTKVGPISTLMSLTSSRKDLANTEFRLGSDNTAGLINHNGSFESYGASRHVNEAIGRWHTWCVTYDGWMERVYIDGKLIHEQNNFIMIRPEGYITIGADASGTNNFMGYINDIRLLPKSMTADEIVSLHDSFEQQKTLPSLGDDDFEEIDPDSKFSLNKAFKLQLEINDTITLASESGAFNEAPLYNGGRILKEIEGDFVIQCNVCDMEGLSTHSVKSYNEAGLLIADNKNTYYHFGAFPLYNCGNMLTILSPHGRPQHPNYKGYKYDHIMQFERRGNLLYARSSVDGSTWENSQGSPITISSSTLKVGLYQTTYTNTQSWAKIKDIRIWYK